MASFVERNPPLGSTSALAVLGVFMPGLFVPVLLVPVLLVPALIAPALLAQTVPSASRSIVLDRKAATRLLVDEFKPEYPTLAKLNYIQGSVRMELHVTREGRVEDAHVVHGHPFLAEAALQAVRRWIYRPLKKGSAAAEFMTFVDVKFALHSRTIEQLPPTPERDLGRQIRPPALLGDARPDAVQSGPPPGAPPAGSVRMHVLVGEKGHAVDAEPLAGPPAAFDAARKQVEAWKFRPAHWGNHAVPWYLDVDVPVKDARPAVASGGPPPS